LLFEQQGFEFVSFHGSGRILPGFWKGMMMTVRRPI